MNKKLRWMLISLAIVLSVSTLTAIVIADTDIRVLATTAVEKLIKYNVKGGTVITAPRNKPVKDGYDFVGWQLKDDTTDKVYQPNELITISDSMSSNGTNIDFTAVWKENYTVKYAVRIYGINQDVGENGQVLGLTFGPAGGYTDDNGHTYIYTGTGPNNMKYKSCGDNDPTCLHNMTWEQIIAQSKSNPTVFKKCLENRCTHSVLIDMSSGGTEKNGKKKIMNVDYGPNGTKISYDLMKDSDGTSVLLNSIMPDYRRWNYTLTTIGGWQASMIRNMLNGPAAVDENGNLAINSGSKGYALGENDCLFSAFPKVLRDNIIAKRVLSGSSSSRSSELKTTYDKLWLFSTNEMYKEYTNTSYMDNREGTGINGTELYQSQDILNAISTSLESSSTVNVFYSETGSLSNSWTRTLYIKDRSVVFLYIHGYPYYNEAYNFVYAVAVSPGFCLP